MNNLLLGSFQEFLVVLIHSILYCRGVYSPQSFEAVQQYGITVHQSRHPGLRQWIESAVSNCMELLTTGSISKISVVILKNDEINSPLERYVLDLRRLTTASDNNFSSTQPDLIWSILAESYRACIIRLLSVSGTLESSAVPDDSTFTLLLESDDPAATIGQNAEISTIWTVADSGQFHRDFETLERTSPVRLRAIQNVTTDDLAFRFWLEEERK